MSPKWDAKEIISRATMAVLAILLAWGATAMMRYLFSLDPADGRDAVARVLVPPAVVMYVIAFTFGCFVFASRDPSKAKLARVMTWADVILRLLGVPFRNGRRDD